MTIDIIIDDKKTIWKYAKVSVENTKVYNCIVDKKNEFWNGWVNAYLTEDSFKEYYKLQQDYFNSIEDLSDGDKEFKEDIEDTKNNPLIIKDKKFYGCLGICWDYVE
tara:strand:+ start:519 stop:839 length:321 start_codon:yes stop_codon:yes gene_type:complete